MERARTMQTQVHSSHTSVRVCVSDIISFFLSFSFLGKSLGLFGSNRVRRAYLLPIRRAQLRATASAHSAHMLASGAALPSERARKAMQPKPPTPTLQPKKTKSKEEKTKKKVVRAHKQASERASAHIASCANCAAARRRANEIAPFTWAQMAASACVASERASGHLLLAATISITRASTPVSKTVRSRRARCGMA